MKNIAGNLPLTRFGVRHILAKYLRKAGQVQHSFGKKRLHHHSMKHGTAIHLLKSGVDLRSIANWLGHVSVNTTNKHASLCQRLRATRLDLGPAASHTYMLTITHTKSHSEAYQREKKDSLPRTNGV